MSKYSYFWPFNKIFGGRTVNLIHCLSSVQTVARWTVMASHMFTPPATEQTLLSHSPTFPPAHFFFTAAEMPFLNLFIKKAGRQTRLFYLYKLLKRLVCKDGKKRTIKSACLIYWQCTGEVEYQCILSEKKIFTIPGLKQLILQSFHIWAHAKCLYISIYLLILVQ